MMRRIFKIRYNTDFPDVSSYPWRVIEIIAGDWSELLTMHVGIGSPSESTIDILPDGRLKYHITVLPDHVIFGNENEDKGFEKIEFFKSTTL